jgi:hypothetical protein
VALCTRVCCCAVIKLGGRPVPALCIRRYLECRGMLLDPALGFEEVMAAAAGSRDPVIGKYLQRIRTKLDRQ